MLFGLIITNLAFICYMATYNKRHYLEANKSAYPDQLLTVVSFSMTADLFRYLAWNITIWVFAFKYWVVSIEMPKAIENSRRMSIVNKEVDRTDKLLENTELRYQIGLWLGATVNVFATILYICYYGKACMDNTGDDRYKQADIIAYSFMNFCGFVSSCFLGDALRRIYNAFKSYRDLAQNEQVMLLHLLVFIIYSVTTVFKTLQVHNWLGDQTSLKYYNTVLVWYTISVWALFFD